MPIIKDKYGAKGENVRSKYVTRKKNRALYIDPIDYSILNTPQKKSEETKEIRKSDNVQYVRESVETTTSNRLSIISGIKLSTANTVENIVTLSPGESLKDIIISHYAGDEGSGVVSLHWSTTPIGDLTFSIEAGIIVDISGGSAFRLLSDTFINNSTLALNNNNMFDSFNNVSKTIYFYAVTSVKGTEITIVKC